MGKASDNVFPKVILGPAGTTPAAPTDSSWKLYAMADGVFARSSNTTVGPLGAGGGSGVSTDTIWDAAGDLAVGTGANTAAKLTLGSTNGMVVSRVSGSVAWALPPGYEYDYVEKTSDTTINTDTEAGAVTVVTGNAVTYDGSTTILVEFFARHCQPNATNGDNIAFWLYDGSSSIGAMGLVTNPAAQTFRVPVHLARRITPSAAAHTYSIRASVTAAARTGTVGAGAGGSGAAMPAFIRITKV